MAHFDRFDICEAHLALEWDWNLSGWLQERPSNRRRRESTDVQLARMGFKHGPGFKGFESLSENGREIYQELEIRYGFHSPECPGCEGCADETWGEPTEPGEDDWVTTDHKVFTQCGKRILTLTGNESEEEMWVQLLRAMSDGSYWPDVWFISDHGNAHLMKRPSGEGA